MRPERRSGRRRGHDYRAGTYFVTICAGERGALFGALINGEMRANDLGKIVGQCWRAIPEHDASVILDEFVLMPDHVHGLLRLATGRACPVPTVSAMDGTIRPSPHLGTIVGSFKSATARLINFHRATPGATVWQRGYYEHRVRGEDDLRRIREYIIGNPRRGEDRPARERR